MTTGYNEALKIRLAQKTPAVPLAHSVAERAHRSDHSVEGLTQLAVDAVALCERLGDAVTLLLIMQHHQLEADQRELLDGALAMLMAPSPLDADEC